MPEKVTTKQAAASVRKTLGMLAKGPIRTGSGDRIEVPPGLGFSVRATTKGANITIEDHGWVDRVTGGDRKTIGEHKQEAEAIVAEVDKVRRLFSPELPGTTKWGFIVIGSHLIRERGTLHASSRDRACDRCGSEVGEWREVAGTAFSLDVERPEVMCVPCYQKFMDSGE